MSREIKFRAWDKENKYMIDDMYVACYVLKEVREHPELELMQFTGLKDTNNKEIYEGDILSFSVFDYNGSDTQYKGAVEWIGTRFVISSEKEHGNFGADGPFDLDWVFEQDDEPEVIGNIYDNHELLKELC